MSTAPSHSRIHAAIVVNGRRVPVEVISRGRAWSRVRSVPTQFSRTWRLLIGERRVATARLLPVTDGDRFWWVEFPNLDDVRSISAVTPDDTTLGKVDV